MKPKIPKALKTRYIWFDGKFIRHRDASIHILNHSLHYGSAAFEGERFYLTDQGPATFRLSEHTRRLKLSAAAVGMRLPYSIQDIKTATAKLICSNNLREGYIRPIVFYGAKMELAPVGAPVHMAIAVWPWKKYLGDKPIRVKIVSIVRLHPKTIFPHTKISGYYANSILATLEAKRAGYDEALLLDYEGNLAEGPGENFFMVKKRKILTPALGSILPGITRDSIIKMARHFGFQVVERKIRSVEALSADEAFLTGTAAEVTPIAYINKKKIGVGTTGPVTAILQKRYADVVRGRIPRYRRWLTYV